MAFLFSAFALQPFALNLRRAHLAVPHRDAALSGRPPLCPNGPLTRWIFEFFFESPALRFAFAIEPICFMGYLERLNPELTPYGSDPDLNYSFLCLKVIEIKW